MVVPVVGSCWECVTAPWDLAFNGPAWVTTVAVIVVSDSLSVDSQPGIAAFSTPGSFNARYTRSRGAAIRSLPVISMAVCSPTVFSPLALKLTKVGGRAKQTHIAVPASPSRRVVIFACGRAAAAPALFHNLGDDGKGDL